MPPQTRQAGSGFAAVDPVERAAHRRPVAAGQALDLVHGAVDLEHAVRRRAGRLVQPVDVLGDQREQPALALEVDQRAVPGVGPISPACRSRRISQARRRMSGSAR